MKLMLLGTCRMHDPAKAMRDDASLVVRGTPHRLHTPRQTLQFIEHVSGTPRFDEKTIHLMSDYATDQIFTHDVARAQVLDDLKFIQAWWTRFDVFFIELCSFREFTAQIDGQEFVLNTFSQRDQDLHRAAIQSAADQGQSVPPLDVQSQRLTQRQVIEGMQKIRAALGNRPIVWVSHMRTPSDDARYDVVNQVRKHNADVLQAGAKMLGNAFFDPSQVAAELGQQAFFLKDGEDLDHMTPAAATRLAEIYKAMASDLLQKPRARAAAGGA